MLWIANILAVFLLSVLLAGIMIPQILLISFRKKLFDEPDERKIHTSSVPRLGGIAFIPVILISIAMIIGIDIKIGEGVLGGRMIESFETIAFSSSALMILYIVGMADDLVGIKYRAKFVAQILCGILLIMGGMSISDFQGFLFLHEIPNLIAWPFTILLAVFIINSINLIDGVDGLASGLSMVALLTYGIVFYLSRHYVLAMVATAGFGVLIQFFYYNVFGNPQKQKKIFMGDTGSLTIGLLLCILSFRILGIGNENEFNNERVLNMLVVAFSPLVVPCFDVIRVYFYRIRHGRNPFLPDKNHIHHRLLARGLSQRVTMMIIISVSILFTAFNIFLSYWINVNLIIVIDLVVWTFSMSILARTLRKLNKTEA